ncbi:DUF4097 family beta strand repeat-containing protein [uncultured Spirosoma sp.]|uniref:DUF4097 family beta strand repeat-containing protein n=1 Tax=uncultured Spirosoma sp. TaxID=278208 RepID=UPI002583C4F2|nr:DUF4097 family beta strand repeat-containing protein [uncultured Spirosoma sp.]
MKAQLKGWRLLIWFSLYLASMPGRAQPALQVVTKVVEKELPYSAGQRLRLTAEKADVTIHGWTRPVVSVRLRLTAKHPDRAVAEREVGYQQYSLQANGNEIELANHYAVPRGAGKVQSQLKAIYDISVPAGASLLLKNSFGDIRLADLTGDTNLTFEFGKLSLEDVGGKTTIRSSYGDIDGRGVDGSLLLTTEKADVSLRDLAGRAVVKSRYGKLTVVPHPSLTSLSVEAARTDVLLAARRLGDFQYDVITTFADIRVPEAQQAELGKLGSKQTFTYQPPGRKPLIQIQDSYGNVTIQADKPLVDR